VPVRVPPPGVAHLCVADRLVFYKSLPRAAALAAVGLTPATLAAHARRVAAEHRALYGTALDGPSEAVASLLPAPRPAPRPAPVLAPRPELAPVPRPVLAVAYLRRHRPPAGDLRRAVLA
jgi:lipoprotein NlpD